jgi:hypothetical protein
LFRLTINYFLILAFNQSPHDFHGQCSLVANCGQMQNQKQVKVSSRVVKEVIERLGLE